MRFEHSVLNELVNRNKYMTILQKITMIRDTLTLFICVSSVHLSINYLSQSSECLYHVYGVCFVPILSFVCFMSISNNNMGGWPVVFDVLGLLIGSFFQIITKPNGWWAEASSVGCNIDDSPVALQYFFLGEIISFSVAMRFILWTIAFWKGMARWSIIFSTVICAISFSFALNSLTTSLKVE